MKEIRIIKKISLRVPVTILTLTLTIINIKPGRGVEKGGKMSLKSGKLNLSIAKECDTDVKTKI